MAADKIVALQVDPGVRLFAFLIPAFIPILHMFITVSYVWPEHVETVDKSDCSCSCWDTAFKGSYEKNHNRYKHVYFNATRNSAFIWLLAACGTIVCYECAKHVIAVLALGTCRLPFLLSLVFSFYSHYYAWWMAFNSANDEFYDQVWHQAVFTITELVSTRECLISVDSQRPLESSRLLRIFVIAVAHVICSFRDQFFSNVVLSEGAAHQVMRDLGFFLADVYNVGLSVWGLRDLGKREKAPALHLISDQVFFRHLCLLVVIVVMYFML